MKKIQPAEFFQFTREQAVLLEPGRGIGHQALEFLPESQIGLHETPGHRRPLFLTAVAGLGKVLLDVKQGVVFEFGVRPEKSLQLLDREELPLHVPGIAGAESLRQGPQQFQPGGAHGAVPLRVFDLFEVRRHLIQSAVKSGHLGFGKWRRILLEKGAGKLPGRVIAQRRRDEQGRGGGRQAAPPPSPARR